MGLVAAQYVPFVNFLLLKIYQQNSHTESSYFDLDSHFLRHLLRFLVTNHDNVNKYLLFRQSTFLTTYLV